MLLCLKTSRHDLIHKKNKFLTLVPFHLTKVTCLLGMTGKMLLMDKRCFCHMKTKTNVLKTAHNVHFTPLFLKTC